MNHFRPFASTNNLFKPAASFLSSLTDASASKRRPSSLPGVRSSIDEPDVEALEHHYHAASRTASAPMSRSMHRASSSGDLHPPTVPLVDLSRSPSPYARSRSSAAPSEDDDDDDYLDDGGISRPLVASGVDGRSGSGGSSGSGGGGSLGWRRIVRHGGLGRFFFGTWAGWQVYVGFLVFWVGGCGIGLVLMNRFILMTGVFKFPYPLTATWIQLCITHFLLVGFAALTRSLAILFRRLGLEGMVAPSVPASSSANFRNPGKAGDPAIRLLRKLTSGTGGMAGGGLLEFDAKTARQVLPLAVIFMGKVVISTLSFAYADFSVYSLARTATVPLTLILTYFLSGTMHSASVLSASLTATINLLPASIQPVARVTWESVLAGTISSLFAALYPILVLRTHRALVANLTPSADPAYIGGAGSFNLATPDDAETSANGTASFTSSFNTAASGGPPPSCRDETRAHYQLLHYTSLLTLALLSPIVLIWGDLGHIYRNCYVLDLPWVWFLILCGGLGSAAVFGVTPLLVRATSPLTATVVGVPKTALLLVFLNGKNMGAASWVGAGMCLLSSAWYAVVRRGEMRGRLGR